MRTIRSLRRQTTRVLGAALGISACAIVVASHPKPGDAAAPPGRFVALGDGTTADTVTGLTWQEPLGSGHMNWVTAYTYCEDLVLAGHSDWRLPSINELQSIVDETATNPAIDLTAFPGTVGEMYWSSSVRLGKPWPWGLFFEHGVASIDAPETGHRARCVR